MRKQIGLGLLLASLSVWAYAAENIVVKNAWVREAPPGAQVMAAYMTLENPNNTPLSVVGATSTAFKTVELHKTVEEAGVARMIAVDALEVPAGGQVALVPGGLHVMLITPIDQQPQAGDNVSLTLYLSNEASQTLTVPVQKAPLSDTMPAQPHSH